MSQPAEDRHDSIPAQVTRIRAGAIASATEADHLAEETPVALEYNGISHATMLATPADLEDFALGFSLSEGIVDSAADVRGIDVVPQCDGIVVQLEISSACEARLKSRRRAMAGRTGCGLCGVETLPEVLRPVPPVAAGAPLRAQAGRHARHAHAPAPARPDRRHPPQAGPAPTAPSPWCARTWAGTALDKLVGALARHGLAAASGMVLVSSRASFEMVQKTAAAGVPVLAAVSAPPRWPCGWRKRPTSRSWASCATTTPRCTRHPERILS